MMTAERLTEQQIEERAKTLQRQLGTSSKVYEQLKLMVRLDRGGIVKALYDTAGNLQKVGYEQQL